MKSYKWLLPIILLGLWILIYFNLQFVTNWLIDDIFKLAQGKHLTDALRFFIFEVPKVLLLLVLIIFVVGIIRSFFTPERTRKALEGRSLFTGNVMASMLGIVTPFCSCSAIPLFLGFVESGISLGVTFSFLIAAPMINEVAVILFDGSDRLILARNDHPQKSNQNETNPDLCWSGNSRNYHRWVYFQCDLLKYPIVPKVALNNK